MHVCVPHWTRLRTGGFVPLLGQSYRCKSRLLASAMRVSAMCEREVVVERMRKLAWSAVFGGDYLSINYPVLCTAGVDSPRSWFGSESDG